MRVGILHNAVSADASPDERDVLVQVESVGRALRELGHEAPTIPCTLDLEAARHDIVERRCDLVFNLVEALGGSDRLMGLGPALLDVLGVPYAGVPTEGMFLANHKLLAKERLRSRGLPTPPWESEAGSRHAAFSDRAQGVLAPPFIVKAVFEHASFGMDDAAVVTTPERSAQDHLRERRARFGREFFAEAYVDGREFNLSVLAGANGPETLPPAEIDFSAFTGDKPRIVGYAAKWHEETFEFSHTPRTFEFAAGDAPLLAELQSLAIACWRAFGLRGFARVDFRVDRAGRPWILEINPNPCLSPDAGFAAAVDRAGLTFTQAIERIVADALPPAP